VLSSSLDIDLEEACVAVLSSSLDIDLEGACVEEVLANSTHPNIDAGADARLKFMTELWADWADSSKSSMNVFRTTTRMSPSEQTPVQSILIRSGKANLQETSLIH
jgi:hypothetical protein